MNATRGKTAKPKMPSNPNRAMPTRKILDKIRNTGEYGVDPVPSTKYRRGS